MNVDRTVDGDVQTYSVDKGIRPVPFALAFLAFATILQIAMLFAFETVKLPLVVLLATVVVSCAMLVASTLDEMTSAQITLDRNGLSWRSLLKRRSVEWRQITDVELIDAGGSFSTTSLTSGVSSVGVAVTLMSDRPGQPEEQTTVVSGSPEITEDLVRLVEEIKAARRQTAVSAPANSRRIAKPIQPKGEFRRRPSAGQTARSA